MLRKGKKGKVALLCILIFAFSICLYAQVAGTAVVTGVVTDPSGAVVPGARVTVTQQGTGVTRSVVTNQDGRFNIPSLPPSAYTVAVTASGFKNYVESVTLLADQARTLNVRMQVGASTQKVTVEAASAMVNTVTPVLSQVIDQVRVMDLPLNGRNAADLTLLVPGTTNANGHGTQQGTTKQIPGNESISVNGTRTDQIAYNLDGADNQDLLSNTNDPFPFPDAVQEFSVQTSNFSAQYGENAGAVVNVVSKSGTNQWHGDGFEFVRNKAFDARNFFATAPSPLKRNQYGGTIGGPIRKDKSFIFFGYQRTVVSNTIPGQTAVIPTAANLAGDFSNYLTANSAVNPLGKVVQLKDPVTGLPIPNNNLAADPNTPLNQVAENFSKYLPVSTASPNGTVSFEPLFGQTVNEFDVRFDQTVRGQDRLTGRAYIDRFNALPSFDGIDLLTLQNNFSGDGSTVQSQNYMISYTWAKSAEFVNTTYLSYLRTGSDRFQGTNVPQPNQLGSNVYQLPKSQGGYHGFGVSGYFGIGSFTGGAFYRNSVDIRDDANWVRGNHTVTFGGDLEHDQSIVRNTDLLNGNWSFQASDFTGNALANFVTGNLYNFSQDSGNYSDQHQNVQGLYIQDQWHASRRLTLDGGLRYEPQVPMQEIYGRIEQFFPNANAAGVHSSVFPNAPAGLFFVGDSYNGVTVPATGEKGDLDNFAPRLGFAFDPKSDGKTVIRGGAGVFYYTRLPGLFGNDASIISPFSDRIDLFPPVPAYLGGGLSNPLAGQSAFVAAFPERYTLSTAPKNTVLPTPTTAYGLQPGTPWITPAIYSWNLTIQRQLRPDMVFSASYVGNQASNLRQDQNLNPAQYFPGAANAAFDALSTDARRVYPGLSNIFMNSNSGNSNYHSLQVSLEKRPGPGLPGILRNVTLLANYTYSKAMLELAGNGGITDVGSSNGSGVSYGNPYQFAFDRGPADFNHTHAFVLSYVFPLPQLAGSNGFTKTVLGGWDWSGIFSTQSGDFISIMAGTDNSKTGLGGDRVNFVGNVNQLGTGAQQSPTACSASVKFCVPFLNSSLFILPPTGQFGNIGQGAIAGPGFWNYDMGLFKNFYPISSHENFSIQLRGEFFNFFNHPNFNDPNVSLVGSNFGQITGQAGNERIIQVAVKVFF